MVFIKDDLVFSLGGRGLGEGLKDYWGNFRVKKVVFKSSNPSRLRISQLGPVNSWRH